jgi:hypothetical protein
MLVVVATMLMGCSTSRSTPTARFCAVARQIQAENARPSHETSAEQDQARVHSQVHRLAAAARAAHLRPWQMLATGIPNLDQLGAALRPCGLPNSILFHRAVPA